MTQSEQRSIALGAAIYEIRKNDLGKSVGSALAVLDDLSRTNSELIASVWYTNASDRQIKLFEAEFKKQAWRLN